MIETTRALTGWQNAERTRRFNNDANGFNYGKPMEARWTDGHDTGEKKVLGRVIPAGQNAEQDLDSLVKILIEHPNTAPFVSLRLSQNLTASDATMSAAASALAAADAELPTTFSTSLATNCSLVKNLGYTLVNWSFLVNSSTICGMVMTAAASASWFM